MANLDRQSHTTIDDLISHVKSLDSSPASR